jgi:hypothetical protein
MLEPKIILELTAGEASALRQLLHIAVQARGLEVAEVALHLNKRLTEAAGVVAQQPTTNGSAAKVEVQ